MNTKVDKYLIDGCMRCKYGATPKCKVNNWKAALSSLRQIVLNTGLTEELKWGMPCYTNNNKNIVMLCAFKEYCSISFFKGALLKDKNKILLKQGENSQSARIIKFTSEDQVSKQAGDILAYILDAIEVEKSGLKAAVKKNPEVIPVELLEVFKKEPKLEKAFFELTPGRQRGYIIYFTQPKQSASRCSRIEKCKQKIFKAEGLHDKYS